MYIEAKRKKRKEQYSLESLNDANVQRLRVNKTSNFQQTLPALMGFCHFSGIDSAASAQTSCLLGYDPSSLEPRGGCGYMLASSKEE